MKTLFLMFVAVATLNANAKAHFSNDQDFTTEVQLKAAKQLLAEALTGTGMSLVENSINLTNINMIAGDSYYIFDKEDRPSNIRERAAFVTFKLTTAGGQIYDASIYVVRTDNTVRCLPADGVQKVCTFLSLDSSSGKADARISIVDLFSKKAKP